MEVAQENDIAFDQPDKFRRLFKSGPQHLLGSRHNTARTKSGKTTGTRMFQAFKPFAALTWVGLKPEP